MNLLLVRHGETPWNREGRYQGRTDIPLSPDGEAQVARLRDRLAAIRIDRAIASPLSRARRTAEVILAGRLDRVAPEGAPSVGAAPTLELDEGLLEISHGAWEGKLASEVERDHAEMFGTWRTAPGRHSPAGPGAETLGDVEARAWRVLDKLASLGRDQTGLIVAHDAVNRVILCRILGLPLERVWKFRQAPAALNVLEGPSIDELSVVRLHDSDHSSPLVAGVVHAAL